MPRWDPDAARRLLEAGMSLYFERGYDDVTVAEIAERAGLTKRTFFRHFADKREVPFAGAAAFQESVVAGVAAAPDGVAPADAAIGALADGSVELARWAEHAPARRALVASSTDLWERELSKRDSLTAAIAEALRARGVEPLRATLTAQAAVAAFTTGYDRWCDAGATGDLPGLVRATFDDLRTAIG